MLPIDFLNDKELVYFKEKGISEESIFAALHLDFDTLEKGLVTVRHRDSMEQERVALDDLVPFIQKAIKKSLNEWEDPFDETNLENIPTWQTLKNIDEKLFDCYLYNEKDECVGKLGDLHFIYSPKQNKLI